jgi:hypothetical protein
MPLPLVPASTKMQHLAQARDAYARKEITGLDLAILVTLYDAVDRSTGLTQISQRDLARLCGCKPRAAERSTLRLVARGMIEVDRHQIGTRRDGSRVFGGRGGGNRYRLAPHRPSDPTVSTHDVDVAKDGHRDRPRNDQRPSNEERKTVPPDSGLYTPTESQKNPPCDDETMAWSITKRALSEMLGPTGPEIIKSWFEAVTVIDVGDEIIRMSVPSMFSKHWIETNFENALLEAWRRTRPGINRVVLTMMKS